MAAQINLESGDQRVGPGQLDRVLGLGVRGRDLNPPLLAATNQGALEGKTDKIGHPQRASGEQREHQAIAKVDGAVTWRSYLFGCGHHVEAEIE